MNYLAHVFLAEDDPEERLGSLIADFTRGRLQTLEKYYSPGVMRGIALHRKIDTFTDGHPQLLRSRRRFSRARRRYSGIIVDILHDHFLSRHWTRYSTMDRQAFIHTVYQLLQENRQRLPPRLQQVSLLMAEQDWLGSYYHIERLGQAYDRLSRRLRRPNALGGALEEVIGNYSGLERDFGVFFPDLLHCVQSTRHEAGEI